MRTAHTPSYDASQDISHETRVEPIENGFIKHLTVSGTGKNGKWFHKATKRFHRKHPMTPAELRQIKAMHAKAKKTRV